MTTDSMDTRRATFHAMTEGTAEDWGIIAHHNLEFAAGLPDRVLAHLRLLDGDAGGFAVDRLEHSLQTATRAYRAGEDDEYVVCALLHDIGDTLGSYNHADVAAAILKPFVSEENHWLVEKHAVFQGYYFFHYLGLDRDAPRRVPRPPVVRPHGDVLPRVRPAGVRPVVLDAAPRALRACRPRAPRRAAPQHLHARRRRRDGGRRQRRLSPRRDGATPHDWTIRAGATSGRAPAGCRNPLSPTPAAAWRP